MMPKGTKKTKSFHRNLTDAAILKRLAMAKAAAERMIEFRVPLARKSFILSLVPADFPLHTVHKHKNDSFVIIESCDKVK